MELTIEERQTVEKGDVLKYVIPGSSVECVVVREDLLDPLLARLDYSACDVEVPQWRTLPALAWFILNK